MGYALLPALLKGLVDSSAVHLGAAGYLREGEPETPLVEVVGPCGLDGDGYHLGPASLEGLLAVPVGADDDSGPLELEGSLGVNYTFTGTVSMIAFIVYDPRPKKLTGRQLARTYCYGHGEYIGGLMPPSRLLEDEFELFLRGQCA